MMPRIPKNPNPQEIVESLLNESGFLLEQEMSSLLERIGYRVWTNHPYIDQENEIEREVDIVALRELTFANNGAPSKICVCLVCQCKKNSHTLVAFSRDKNQADKNRSPEEYFFPCNVRNKELEQVAPVFYASGLHEFHYYFKDDNEKKSVLICGFLPKNPNDSKKREWNVKNMDHDLVLPVIKPYLAEREAYKLDKKTLHGLDTVEFMKHQERNNIWLFFPMVIVNGPLFELNTSTSKLEPVETKHVTLVRKLKTRYYTGTFLIEFIQKDAVDEFLDKTLEPFVQKVKEEAPNLLS